jgi:parvulin-like peptidyl-prolyl isomerase
LVRRSSTLSAACALLCVLAHASSCKPERPTGASVAPVAAVAEDDVAARPVARIGDRMIRFGEVEDRLDLMPVFVRVRHQTAERKLEFVEAYVQYLVLALEAEARGLGRDGRVLDALKHDRAERWLRRTVDLAVKTSDIPEADVAARYRARWHDFNRPEQVRVRQILVKDRELAERLAFRLRKRSEVHDVDVVAVFEEFVQRWSEDPASKRRGGSIGSFPRLGDEGPPVPDEVVVAVSGMREPFTMSPVIASDDGFRILLVEGVDPAVEKTLDQARPDVVAELMGIERTRLRRARLDALRAEAGVQLDEDGVRRVLEGRAGKGAGDG